MDIQQLVDKYSDGSEELHFTDSASTELPHMPLGSGTPTDEELGPLSSGDEPGGGNLSYAARSPAAEGRVVSGQLSSDGLPNESNSPPAPYLVTFTSTVTLAVSAVKESEAKKDSKSRALQMLGALKALNYFHMETSLLPNADPAKFDLVTFEKAAKLYTTNDSQVLKPWNDGEQRWFVFKHYMELPVTKELLLTLVPHIMTLQIWEGKEKVSPKAKFDRPKNLHNQLDKEGATQGGTKQLVQEQLNLLDFSPLLTTKKETGALPLEPIILESGSFFALGIPAAEGNLEEEQQRKICADLKQSKSVRMALGKKRSSILLLSKGISRKKGKATAKKQTKEKLIPQKIPKKKKVKEKPAPTLIKVDIKPLLAGDKSVTSTSEKLIQGILSVLFTVSVDKSLMSEEAERVLNPMVIRILSASSMPSTPVPIHELQERCDPVYCQYKFYNLPCHQTKGREHGTEISFKDINVILTGTINPDKLKEYLQGPPLVIEIHDRDRKVQPQFQPPALFGTEPEDTKLSNVGLVSNKRTVHDPFMETNKSWDPYGIAKLSFSELVYGATCLNVDVSIQNSDLPDPLGYRTNGLNKRIVGVAGAIDGPEGKPLPKGHYVDSNTVLNVRVKLAYPLSKRRDYAPIEREKCQYGRVIYVFDYKNRTFLQSLLEQINAINSLPLCADSQFSEYGSVDGELKRDYELKGNSQRNSISGSTLENDESSNLDIVTGFHIMDGTFHLFVLEGLKNKGLKTLWENLPVGSMAEGEKRVKVLYNSDFSFDRRLYSNLDDRLYHMYLHEPLSDIVKQPLLYVRDMAPQDCVQALYRLQYLCLAKKLRQVVQSDLFPTAAMITVLSREFGIPASETDPHIFSHLPAIPRVLISKNALSKKTYHAPLDIYNMQYLQSKLSKKILTNHIQNNIDAVYEASIKLEEIKPRSITFVPPEGSEVHNYSIQTFSSSVKAKQLLREQMAQKPNQRFTYSQMFLSGTVAPVDIINEEKKARRRSKKAWLTFDGFQIPGFKGSLEANEHPHKPDEARIDELKKPWKENILHGNLNAPLKQRGSWKWNERHKDFELYKKVSYEPVPTSILQADDTFRAEQLKSIYKKSKEWRKPYRDSTDSKLSLTLLESETELDRCMTVCLNPAIFQKKLQ
ncbi:uncharacterized protein cfap92 isoform X2 [Rhinoraja longicauda]